MVMNEPLYKKKKSYLFLEFAKVVYISLYFVGPYGWAYSGALKRPIISLFYGVKIWSKLKIFIRN
jgi:hypothetical protein